VSGQLLVLDASVGVLWFRGAYGSPEAFRLLEKQADGAADLVVPVNFVYEVLECVRRDFGASGPAAAFERLRLADIGVAPLTADLVREASSVSDALGCSFPEALAPALATILEADLVSADARAHGAYPGVRLIG
jgi:predicted nucleic acid-binding protein